VATLPKSLLYERLRSDIADAGGMSLIVSGSASPRDMIVTLEGVTERVRVYIWNLTYDRTRDDYKFQITSLRGGALEFDFDTRTVLLGHYERTGVYLAADAYRRRRIGGRSNAIQTRQAQLDAAYRDGIHAFEKTGTGEIALVVRNDLIGTYLVESESMHEIGATVGGLARLNRLATAIGGPVDMPPGLRPRDKRESRVLRTIRDGNFRKRVLAAYGFRCCVCSIQLELPEAAHIVEARASLSSDDVRNGLALCPLHHTAYDAGLIGILPTYAIQLNSQRTRALSAASRGGKLREFQGGLRPKIHLPFNRADHPDRGFLKLGLASRGWP
jgi:putative restriction endonuclease